MTSVEERCRALRRLVERLRSPELAGDIVRRIREEVKAAKRALGVEVVRIMHVCGTHEHTITYYGLRSLLPESIELIAGPGCPVCIVPAREVDEAVKLALEEEVAVLTYGDMYRVPGSEVSLAQARARGAKVMVVYGFREAVRLAAKLRRDFVFFAVGFETTQPTVAAYLARGGLPKNLKLLVSYRLTVPAVRYVLNQPDIPLNGVIAPGHVSTITGAGAWSFLPREYGIPAAVAGFEPIDVLIAVLGVLKMISRGRPSIFNEYSRAVTWEGNVLARKMVYEVFQVVDRDWRGIGVLPESGLKLKDAYSSYDARLEYNIKVSSWVDTRPGCRCPDVILGRAKPTDCPMFMKACTPEHPLGACMVSSEGTCSIWARYGGYDRLKVDEHGDLMGGAPSTRGAR